ncbi:MAG: hypothetical protein WKG00_22700 [Polyangiaceae bacterium]
MTANVALPLLGNGVVGDGTGDILLGRIADELPDLAPGSLCKATPAATKDGKPFAPTATGVEGVIGIGRHAYRLRFELGAGGERRLVEASFVLPELGPTPKKPRREFLLSGRVESVSDGSRAFAIIEPTLRQDPACIYEHASRYKESASLLVVASKREGGAAAARVFASTAVPASLVACLERQLDRAYASTFRGIPFEVRYFLMMGLPIPKGQLDPNANTITVGP